MSEDTSSSAHEQLIAENAVGEQQFPRRRGHMRHGMRPSAYCMDGSFLLFLASEDLILLQYLFVWDA